MTVCRADLVDNWKNLAATMRQSAALMRMAGGFGVTDAGRLLLKHAAELERAAGMVDDWIRHNERARE